MDDRKEQLLITEIERAAFHDGPGIRTTVFFAGCPLHCPWCCNPETQQNKRLLMHDSGRCVGCGACASACPAGAVTMHDGRPVFDRKACVLCETCVNLCPAAALSVSGRFMTAEAVLLEVLRDRDYYEATGGGITLSGGEPFLQAGGALRLLELAKQEKIHTAVETTAYADPEVLKKASQLVDLFYIDIKHADADALKAAAGAELDVVCGNIRLLKSLGADILLRTPVIPGFNNSPETVRQIFELVRELGVWKAELLPYHSLGKAKYQKLSMPFPMGEAAVLTAADMEPLAVIGRSMGLDVTVGD